MTDADLQAPARAVSLTTNAARRVAEMIAAEGSSVPLVFRLAVSGGGCSGFQYGFSFDDAVREDDHSFPRDGVTLVIDDASLDLLAGAEIDYVEELIGSSFQVRNPNASSGCGCGQSFAV